MIIRHWIPDRSYTKVDRDVFTHRDLSDGACRLYGYLCGLRNGANFTDAYVMKVLGISQTVLSRRKKELKDLGLLLIDQIAPRVYVAYIGTTTIRASKVKEIWVAEEDDFEAKAKTRALVLGLDDDVA